MKVWHRQLRTLDAFVVVILLGGLAGCGAAGAASPPKATATPTLDPQTQAYVHVLQQYYPPLRADLIASNFECYRIYG